LLGLALVDHVWNMRSIKGRFSPPTRTEAWTRLGEAREGNLGLGQRITKKKKKKNKDTHLSEASFSPSLDYFLGRGHFLKRCYREA